MDAKTYARTLPAILIVSSLGLGACAATTPQAARFPSAAAVARLAGEPFVTAQARPIADVAEWKLTGPLPSTLDGRAHVPLTAGDRLLGEVVAARSGSLLSSEAATCAARELGLFQAAHAGAPPLRLVRFIAARCGLGAANVSNGCHLGAAADGISDERAFESEAAAVRTALAAAVQQAGAAAVEGGLWAGRQASRALVCWAVAPATFAIRSATLAPDDHGAVIVEGDLAAADARLDAVVTAGRFQTWPCALASVRPPRWTLSCPVYRADRAAWIDVTARHADQVGVRSVASLLVWPAGQPDDTYHRLSAEAAAPPVTCPSDGVAGAEPIVACVNQVRRAAGVPALALAAEQARTVAALVPRYLAALRGSAAAGDEQQLSLGLRAGWQTGAELSYGQLAVATQEGPPDPTVLMLGLLEHPLDRAVVLDSRAALVAAGTAPLAETGSTGAVVATYRLTGTIDQPSLVSDVFATINRLRAARGGAPVTLFDGDSGRTMRDADAVTAGRRNLSQAISDAAEISAERVKLEHIHGWTREMDDPSLLVPPEALFSVAEVTVGVGRLRRPGEPWSRLVALLVAPHEARDNVGADIGVTFSSHAYENYGK